MLLANETGDDNACDAKEPTMDYEFVAGADGRLQAKLSMGQEAIGHWINDELGTDLPRLDALLNAIAQLQCGEVEQLRFPGQVYSLLMGDDEVEVMANVVNFTFPEELEVDMAYYDDEQMAGCGLDDFQSLLQAWRAFVVEEHATDMASAH